MYKYKILKNRNNNTNKDYKRNIKNKIVKLLIAKTLMKCFKITLYKTSQKI